MLALDIGNTRLKWARVTAGRLSEPGQLEHMGHPCSAVRDVLAGLGWRPERVLVANVTGPDTAAALAELGKSLGRLQFEFAASRPSVGPVRNGYADYRQLGVDRWLALLAAYQRKRQATCIADAGTALTVDLVADDGQHLGGFIVPGHRLMRAALRWRTGGVGGVEAAALPGGVAPGPGRSTGDAITAGTLLAMAGLVDRAAEGLRARSGSVALVVTGGDADLLAPELALPAEICPHLVLEGLVLQAGC